MLKQFSLIIILVLLCFSFSVTQRNNVCNSLSGYLDMDNDDDCWYDPDVCSSPEQIIKRKGYNFEIHRVVAEDGYQNVLYRVPNNVTGWPILLLGGIAGSSLTFLESGDRSIVFFLANNGFDVWLANRRGSFEENQNKTFWDFSFHETGYYDVMAQVDFIRNFTNFRKKVILLGFSMGTTESYVYAILRRRHAKKNLSGIISIAPVAFMGHFTGLLSKLAPFARLIEFILRINNIHVLKKKNTTERITFGKIIFRRRLMFAIAGPDSGQINTAELPNHFCEAMTITVQTLLHYAQEINSGGKFQHYDYGHCGNKIVYDWPTPPGYNISKIRVPVHLFHGEGDFLSTPEDVMKLYKTLAVKNKSLTSISTDGKIKFNHVDFMLGKNITTLFHEVLLKTIKKKLRA